MMDNETCIYHCYGMGGFSLGLGNTPAFERCFWAFGIWYLALHWLWYCAALRALASFITCVKLRILVDEYALLLACI